MNNKFKKVFKGDCEPDTVQLVPAHFRVFCDNTGSGELVQIKITPFYFEHGYPDFFDPKYGQTEEYAIRDQIKAQVPAATSWSHSKCRYHVYSENLHTGERTYLTDPDGWRVNYDYQDAVDQIHVLSGDLKNTVYKKEVVV